MWAAIFGVLASLPKFLSLAETIGTWIIDQVNAIKRKNAQEELDKGVDQAKKEKDTSGLDNLFGGK